MPCRVDKCQHSGAPLCGRFAETSDAHTGPVQCRHLCELSETHSVASVVVRGCCCSSSCDGVWSVARSCLILVLNIIIRVHVFCLHNIAGRSFNITRMLAINMAIPNLMVAIVFMLVHTYIKTLLKWWQNASSWHNKSQCSITCDRLGRPNQKQFYRVRLLSTGLDALSTRIARCSCVWWGESWLLSTLPAPHQVTQSLPCPIADGRLNAARLYAPWRQSVQPLDGLGTWRVCQRLTAEIYRWEKFSECRLNDAWNKCI